LRDYNINCNGYHHMMTIVMPSSCWLCLAVLIMSIIMDIVVILALIIIFIT